MNLSYPFPSYLISMIHKISDLLVSYILAILNNLVCFQTDEGYISFIRDLVPDLCSESESAIINLLKSFYLSLARLSYYRIINNSTYTSNDLENISISSFQRYKHVSPSWGGFLYNLDIIFCRNLRCIKGRWSHRVSSIRGLGVKSRILKKKMLH